VNLSDLLDLDRAIKKEEERERIPARVPASPIPARARRDQPPASLRWCPEAR
jgi:hypothetical protein